jgi:hypothetical protein
MALMHALDQATEVFKDVVEEGHINVQLVFELNEGGEIELYLQFNSEALGTPTRAEDEKKVEAILKDLNSNAISMSTGLYTIRLNFNLEGDY